MFFENIEASDNFIYILQYNIVNLFIYRRGQPLRNFIFLCFLREYFWYKIWSDLTKELWLFCSEKILFIFVYM